MLMITYSVLYECFSIRYDVNMHSIFMLLLFSFCLVIYQFDTVNTYLWEQRAVSNEQQVIATREEKKIHFEWIKSLWFDVEHHFFRRFISVLGIKSIDENWSFSKTTVKQIIIIIIIVLHLLGNVGDLNTWIWIGVHLWLYLKILF